MTKRSTTKPPPKAWVYFTDRDLGNTIPDALEAKGWLVARHDDHFPDPKTLDEDWLPKVAERGWVALSHNKKMRRVVKQRDILMRSGLAMFYLIGHLTHDELTTNLIATMSKIERFRNKHEPPFIAHVRRPETKFPLGSRPGDVELMLTKEEWEQRLAEDEG